MAKKTTASKAAKEIAPATPNQDPTPTENPATVNAQDNPYEITHLCAACSATYGKALDGVTAGEDGKPDYTAAVMWSKPKKPGTANDTEVICATCKALAEQEAEEKGEPKPVFHPLAASIERDVRWDQNRVRYEERKQNAEGRRDEFLGKLYDQGLRTAREDVVCHICGKTHGHIQYFKPRGERFTVIEHATTAVNDGKTVVLPICRDCRSEAAEALGDQYHDVFYREAIRQATEANTKADKFAAFVKPATPRYIPRGKRS